MRVAIADDSVLFREGLARLLGDLNVEVIWTGGTGDDLVAEATASQPDVAIVDIRMPPTFNDEGLHAAEAIRSQAPAVAVLLLSTYAESSYASRLLATGARQVGYLLKDRVDDPTTLRDVLERLQAGDTVIDPEVVTRLVHHRRHQTRLDRLSQREQAVLHLMAEGRSNGGIGRALFLSGKTVEAHVCSVFTKLDLPPEPDDNRRVRAVITWLRAHGNSPDQRGTALP